jgi:hypothetical protein
MVADDLIWVDFSENELSYQMVGNRIMITIYGNTSIFIYSGFYYPGCIISGRKREEIFFFLT